MPFVVVSLSSEPEPSISERSGDDDVDRTVVVTPISISDSSDVEVD